MIHPTRGYGLSVFSSTGHDVESSSTDQYFWPLMVRPRKRKGKCEEKEFLAMENGELRVMIIRKKVCECCSYINILRPEIMVPLVTSSGRQNYATSLAD